MSIQVKMLVWLLSVAGIIAFLSFVDNNGYRRGVADELAKQTAEKLKGK